MTTHAAGYGAVACGHPQTAAAAAEILRDGGNAIDAVIAAQFAACAAEPVLASLGGGGFLLAQRAGAPPRLFDFFAQTPKRLNPDAHMHPISADFGPASQTFHIGAGSMATPGIPAGMAAIHRWGATLPMSRLVEPACRLARHGVLINAFQGYIFDIVGSIFRATPAARDHYPAKRIAPGARLALPDLADTMERIAVSGPKAFYSGEIGQAIVDTCAREGGHLTEADLTGYRVYERNPLHAHYRGFDITTNPPPSAGGVLICHALDLLDSVPPGARIWGDDEYLSSLSRAMHLTGSARESLISNPGAASALLAKHRKQLAEWQFSRGTTHISVIDHLGNSAAMTLSNGEGSGQMIPGTGVMLNNMLGEEDINPEGIGRWPCDVRLGSMMAPTLVRRSDPNDPAISLTVALGSGGSNRIRSAILQVLVNLIDHSADLYSAVAAARAHLEEGLLSLESGFDPEAVRAAGDHWDVHEWPERNLFFGGVHVVSRRGEQFAAAGDPRRGGFATIVR